MKNAEKIIVSFGLAFLGVLYYKNRQVRLPKGAKPVKKFEVLKYLGKWYEIARLDFKYEKNMINVTAEYSPNPDGTIKVENKGFDVDKNEWKTSIGEAQFVSDMNKARLKVSFQKPFWAGYNVVDIDKDYKYALVVGNSTKYLWILSREKTIPDEVRDEFLIKAIRLGYETRDLVWTHHD